MKKKVFKILAVAIFTLATFFSFNVSKTDNLQNITSLSEIASLSEAQAENNICENGCLVDRGLCHCYKNYIRKEASW